MIDALFFLSGLNLGVAYALVATGVSPWANIIAGVMGYACALFIQRRNKRERDL